MASKVLIVVEDPRAATRAIQRVFPYAEQVVIGVKDTRTGMQVLQKYQNVVAVVVDLDVPQAPDFLRDVATVFPAIKRIVLSNTPVDNSVLPKPTPADRLLAKVFGD